VLVLTRKTEQGIVIDGQTIVRVLSVDGERVKLGIDAPAHIAILREELVKEVAGANREAAESGPRGALMERLRSIQDAPQPTQPPPSPPERGA
jgi:carbon storage regulator